MARLFGISRKKAGIAPGTVEYVGEQKAEKVRISLIDYDQAEVVERDVAGITDCFPYRDSPTKTWINIDGLHDTNILKELGGHFGLHPLVVEDIVSVHQRPKMEDFGDYLYIVCRMVYYNEPAHRIDTEQISLVLGPNHVLSFQEQEGDVFEPVRVRLRNGKGRIRKAGSDYLMYCLLDAVVDNYFLVLERFSDQIESLEEDLLVRPTNQMLETIHKLKREMILLRRSVWPLREVVARLERAESDLIAGDTALFLRDVYDHTIQAADAVESFRDLLSGLQDLYLTSISNRMNEVMKVLTIAATVFVPLTFVAGIYGMNFEFMPELKWKWSYPVFWIVVIGLGGGMLGLFRRKRWF